MGELISFDRLSYYVSEELSATFAEILKISGKSYPALFRTISHFKLSSEEFSDPTRPVSIAMKNMQAIPAMKYPAAKAGRGHTNLLRGNSEASTRKGNTHYRRQAKA